MKSYLFETLTRLVTRRNKLADLDAESRFLQYTVICCAGLATMIGFGLYNLLQGQYLLFFAIATSALGLLIGWILLYRGKPGTMIYRGNVLLFYALLLYLTFLGGEDHSKILWVYIAPLITFFLLGRREGLVWVGFMWLYLFVYFFNPLQLPGGHVYSVVYAVRLLVSFTVISVITYFYENFRFRYRVDLEEKNRLLSAQVEERQKAEASLRESEARYRAIYLHAAEGIMLINFQGEIVECNPQILAMLGYRQADVVGRNIFSFFHPEDLARLPPQLDKLRSGEVLFLERRLRNASGVYLLCEQSGKKINDDLIILLYRDITERKIAELALERANQALDRLAHLDGLTQIANRRRFDQALGTEWLRMKREDKKIGLIMADIDYFKQYNDIYGHQAGDDCLRSVASTLAFLVHRPADLVARYGGEEFVVLLPDTELEGCRQIAEKMRLKIEQLRIPHSGSNAQSVVTMSFGVAVESPGTDGGCEMLIRAADKALYQAKEGGRNRVA